MYRLVALAQNTVELIKVVRSVDTTHHVLEVPTDLEHERYSTRHELRNKLSPQLLDNGRLYVMIEMIVVQEPGAERMFRSQQRLHSTRRPVDRLHWNTWRYVAFDCTHHVRDVPVFCRTGLGDVVEPKAEGDARGQDERRDCNVPGGTEDGEDEQG